MISDYQKRYCDEFHLIENYEEAVSDKEQVWDIHHRKETDENFTRKDLIKMGLYYHRPPCELIFIPHSEHIRMHHKGKKRPSEVVKKVADSNRGHKRTQEQRKRISDSHKGQIPPNKGVHGVYHHTDEAKHKISKRFKGIKLSEEHKAKLRKPVSQYTKDGEFIATYPSARDAEQHTGVHECSISRCCNGKYKSAGGFIWRRA